MLLTLTTTAPQADELGFLLHKHPSRLQTFDLSFGQAHIFYPEISPTRCTVALMLQIDPVAIVRSGSRLLDAYVSDRPYVASSFMSVAIGKTMSTALSGKCRERPERVNEAMPFEVNLAALSCHGGEEFLKGVFEPLDYVVKAKQYPVDETFPQWGESELFSVTLKTKRRLRDVLSHLYVLIPVLDDSKHYYVDAEEVDKLMRHGQAWLPKHPQQKQITERYLKYKRQLVHEARERLRDDATDDDVQAEEREVSLETPVRLNEQRLRAVLEHLKDSGATHVLDLGCGAGKLIERLLEERQFEKIVGVDASIRSLQLASARLRLNRHPRRRARVQLLHSALTYRDERLKGSHAAALVEVIEHLDPTRLQALEQAVFEYARPRRVIVTTPNAEYNVRFDTLPAGKYRHADHRFEWTQAQFRAWAENVATMFDYKVMFAPIGEVDAEVGSPTQMAVFDLKAANQSI